MQDKASGEQPVSEKLTAVPDARPETEIAAVLPPRSKAAYVLDRLRHEMSTGLIAPGDQLVQMELSGRYGVSITPVREALRILEAEGRITYTTHRGATVRELPTQERSDLYRMRAEIEGLATELAAARMTSDSLARIRLAHDELRRASQPATADPATLFELNRALHFAIYTAGSQLIASHVEAMWRMFPPSVTVWTDRRAVRPLSSDHRNIVEALEAGDQQLARERMAEHILHVERVRSSLQQGAS